ncbi:MAG: tetratricopeptide repeat protein, partial [Anaerolineae bacterium]
PGTGKTALATALAHDSGILHTFPDGVLWVSLGEGSDVQGAQALWGRALGSDLSHIPDTATRSQVLRKLLDRHRCLIVIDDVLDAEQVRQLNIGGPGCARIIITSSDEVAFGLKSRRYLISGMSELEALSLLTEWSGLLPDIYLPTVKEIIKRLGNSPLALALVGGQARQGITWLRLLEVLRNDQGPIATLDTKDKGVQRSALGLIVNLVLSRFGGARLRQAALLGAVAAGTSAPFSTMAAAACWGVSPDTARETLGLLVESALVQKINDRLYTIHEALRNHLRRAATPSELKQATENVHHYYLSLAEGQLGPGQNIEDELGQVMAAMRATRQTNPGVARLFVDALISTFEQRGLWAHLVMLATETVEEANRDGDVMREQTYLNDLGYAQTVLGNYDEAMHRFKRTLEISRALGDPAGEANALNNIGAVSERRGSLADAERYYRQSLTIRERLGTREELADTLNNLAGVLYQQGRFEAALTAFQRVLDMYGVLGSRSGEAQTLLNIGTTYESMGQDSEAAQAYERSLAIYSNINLTVGQAQALNNLGIVYFNQGDTDRALRHFRQSQELKERLGDRLGQASTLNNIALLYENTGSPQMALEHYQRSYDILERLDDPRAQVVLENIELLRQRMRGE